MKDLGIFDSREIEDRETLCKGRIYRCNKNLFIGKNGSYNEQVRMTPMKRLSCHGCEYCAYLPESLSESVSCGTPVIIKNPVDHALYRLEITNISRDYESGIVDDWDTEFIKQKKEIQ